MNHSQFGSCVGWVEQSATHRWVISAPHQN
jgi:hypothetical protein